MADTHVIEEAQVIETISRKEFASLIPATAINTETLTLGEYKYLDKIEGKYNTKYQYENVLTGDVFNLTLKALSSFRINNKLMLKELVMAKDYQLAPSFNVVTASVEPATADKRYPMYCFSGYKAFSELANQLQSEKKPVPQSAYDTLYATDISPEHVDRYYRTIHVDSPLLVPSDTE